MGISKENREFIDSLLEHYTSESGSYRQIAENFVPEVESVADTAFGIIAGCVYSGFLQAYQNQQQTPGLEDMQEFNGIIKERAPLIKKAILGRVHGAGAGGSGADGDSGVDTDGPDVDTDGPDGTKTEKTATVPTAAGDHAAVPSRGRATVQFNSNRCRRDTMAVDGSKIIFMLGVAGATATAAIALYFSIR